MVVSGLQPKVITCASAPVGRDAGEQREGKRDGKGGGQGGKDACMVTS